MRHLACTEVALRNDRSLLQSRWAAHTPARRAQSFLLCPYQLPPRFSLARARSPHESPLPPSLYAAKVRQVRLEALRHLGPHDQWCPMLWMRQLDLHGSKHQPIGPRGSDLPSAPPAAIRTVAVRTRRLSAIVAILIVAILVVADDWVTEELSVPPSRCVRPVSGKKSTRVTSAPPGPPVTKTTPE